MQKVCLMLLAFALLVLSLAACSGQKGPTVRIGLIAELTGDMPAVGESCKKAAEMAVQEVNDRGGLAIAGKKYKLELFVEDNGGKADQSAAVAQKLITQRQVHALVGPNATRPRRSHRS